MEVEWEQATLANVSADVSYGYTESASDEKVGPHFLRITDIQNGVVNWGAVPYCPISDADHTKYRLQVGDIVVARTGNSTGENFLYRGNEDAVFASYLIRFRVDRQIADPAFVWYNLRSDKWWSFINNSKTGSAQAGANARVLGLFPICLPPLREQRAIAGVLGALDDKIEMNRRTSRTLEKLARAIFRAWFVDFEPVKAKATGARSFPGMPQEAFDALPTRLVPSELGPIPEGWEVRKVGDCITRHSVGRRYDQKTVLPTGNVPVLDQGKSGIIGYHNDEPGVVASLAEPKIVFANHTCYMRLITFPFSTIQNVLPLTGKSVDTIWIYYATLDIQPFIEYKGHWPDFVINEIIFPPKEFTAVFRTCIHPMTIKSEQVDRESRTLAALRDYLLPKLLSGEVRVEARNA
jgi:type I restriction enzyme S subunit